MKQATSPTPFTAADGVACVSLPLANREERWFTTEEAYEDLMKAGMSGRWRLSHGVRRIGYVAGWLPGYGHQVIARLIARARKGEQVSHRDGNRLNLRPENLVIGDCGHARTESALILQHAQDQRDATAQVAA